MKRRTPPALAIGLVVAGGLAVARAQDRLPPNATVIPTTWGTAMTRGSISGLRSTEYTLHRPALSDQKTSEKFAGKKVNRLARLR